MIRKITDLILVMTIAIGGVFAWRTGAERARLEATYRRLARITGDFAVADPSKIQTRALETGEPLSFAWRIHQPPKAMIVLSNPPGGIASPPAPAKAREFIARFRLGEDDPGEIRSQIRTSRGGGTSSAIGDRSLADFFRAHHSRLIVEQLGSGGLVAIEPGRPTVLLRLTWPDSLRQEAMTMLSPAARAVHFPVLREMIMQPRLPKP